MDIRQARREYKFHLRPGQAEAVFDDIKKMLPGDRFGTGGAYPIVSEYYDTDERDAFWERNRKIANRRKLRVRIYGTATGEIPPSAFLEVKHKQDGVGVKRRIRVPVGAVTKPDFDVGKLVRELEPKMECKTELLLAEEIMLLLESRGVSPSIQMRYDRVAFEGMDGEDEVRVTFDKEIRCRTERKPLVPDDPDFPCRVLPEGELVMEVKIFGSAPYWLREMTAKHRLTRTPFSKYCGAIEKFDPVFKRLVGGRMTRIA
jgi:SPX domain protein involved in polyphosphate accumulation